MLKINRSVWRVKSNSKHFHDHSQKLQLSFLGVQEKTLQFEKYNKENVQKIFKIQNV